MSYRKKLPPKLVKKSKLVEALRNASQGDQETTQLIALLENSQGDEVILSGFKVSTANSSSPPRKKL